MDKLFSILFMNDLSERNHVHCFTFAKSITDVAIEKSLTEIAVHVVEIGKANEANVHLFASRSIHNHEVRQWNIKSCGLARVTGHTDPTGGGTELYNEPDFPFSEELINKVFLVFEILDEF